MHTRKCMKGRKKKQMTTNEKTKRVDTVPDKGRVVHSGYSPLLKTSGKKKGKASRASKA
jgi:hypothetical protein